MRWQKCKKTLICHRYRIAVVLCTIAIIVFLIIIPINIRLNYGIVGRINNIFKIGSVFDPNIHSTGEMYGIASFKDKLLGPLLSLLFFIHTIFAFITGTYNTDYLGIPKGDIIRNAKLPIIGLRLFSLVITPLALLSMLKKSVGMLLVPGWFVLFSIAMEINLILCYFSIRIVDTKSLKSLVRYIIFLELNDDYEYKNASVTAFSTFETISKPVSPTLDVIIQNAIKGDAASLNFISDFVQIVIRDSVINESSYRLKPFKCFYLVPYSGLITPPYYRLDRLFFLIVSQFMKADKAFLSSHLYKRIRDALDARENKELEYKNTDDHIIEVVHAIRCGIMWGIVSELSSDHDFVELFEYRTRRDPELAYFDLIYLITFCVLRSLKDDFSSHKCRKLYNIFEKVNINKLIETPRYYGMKNEKDIKEIIKKQISRIWNLYTIHERIDLSISVKQKILFDNDLETLCCQDGNLHHCAYSYWFFYLLRLCS